MRSLHKIAWLVGGLLLLACNDDASSVDDTERRAVLRSITCEAESYTLDDGGEVEIAFLVDEPSALFNYATSSDECQVQLRLADNISQRPSEVELGQVREDAEVEGRYIASISDSTKGDIYSIEIHIAIKLASGEVVLSNPITITSANYVGGIVGVRISKVHNPSLEADILFDYDPYSHTFSAHIDGYISDRSFVAKIECDGVDRVEIRGKEIEPQAATIDFSSDVEVVAFMGDYRANYTLHLECFTGLPVLCIDTPAHQEVLSKEDWVEGSTLRLDGMGRFESIESIGLSIRGRGNSTWGYEKKPYALKLDKKREMMGMPKHKRWVLLANYMDRTLLRNRVAYFLAEQTSLRWTPRCEFVELILNGEHLGQYLLCEQIKVDTERADITEMTPEDISGEAITGGYMLELDFHFDNEWQWHTSHGVPFAVKYPEEEDLTAEQLAWIKSYIGDTEETLYGEEFCDKEHGYQRYIDPESFIDYWLIYELCVNHELANPGSVYLTKDRGGRLVAGPVWDFDWGTFSYNASPAAQWGLFMTEAWWYKRLFDDPEFMTLAAERWQLLKPRFMEVFDFIARERDYIYRSWIENFDIWSISTNINGDEWLSFGEAIDRMETILEERIAIIDSSL